MLQGHRIWAEKPSLVHYLLRRTSSLLVAYSPRIYPAEAANPVSNSPSLAISTSAYSLQRPPGKPEETLKTQISRILDHRQRQKADLAVGRSSLNVPYRSIIGSSRARNLSTLTTASDSDIAQPILLSEHVRKNPTVARLVPSGTRIMATSVRKTTSTYTRSEPENPFSSEMKTQAKEKKQTSKAKYEKALEAQVRMLQLQLKILRQKSKESLKNWKSLEKDIYNILGLGRKSKSDIETSLAIVGDKESSKKKRVSPFDDTSITSHLEKRVKKKVTTFTLGAETPEPKPSRQLPFNLLEVPPLADVLFEDLKFTPEPGPPHTPLQYQMDPALLLRKKLLQDGSTNKFWNYQLYRGQGKPVSVHYCKTFEETEKIAKLFMNDKVIGFDMEWMSYRNASTSQSPRIHASLIQIANESDIALFHVSLFKQPDNKLIPPSLQEIIKSKSILKVGVSIIGDAKRMYNYHKVQPQGLFELSDLENLLATAEIGEGRIPRRLIALSKLVEQYLQLPLSKGWVRTSDWSGPLSDSQIRYAANDAYAGFRVFDALEEKRKELRPSPPFPACRQLQLVETAIKTSERVEITRVTSKKPVARMVNGARRAVLK